MRELTLPGLQGTPDSPGDLELQCRVLACQAEKRLGEIAAARGLRWSFRSVRGRILTEAAAAAARPDLLALGSRSRPIGRARRVDPSVQALIGAAGASALLLRPTGRPAVRCTA